MPRPMVNSPRLQPRRGAFMRRVRALARCEDGATTVEWAVYLPVFLAMILLSFDIGLTFYGVSKMWDTARYTARRASTGELTAVQAQAYALTLLPANNSYTVVVDDSNEDNVVVTISSDNVSPFLGFLEMFTPETLTASYVMYKEVD